MHGLQFKYWNPCKIQMSLILENKHLWFSFYTKANIQCGKLFVLAAQFWVCHFTLNVHMGRRDSKVICENEEHGMFDQGPLSPAQAISRATEKQQSAVSMHPSYQSWVICRPKRWWAMPAFTFIGYGKLLTRVLEKMCIWSAYYRLQISKQLETVEVMAKIEI